ncbi:hypothetical protein DNU06_12925 [Putridiphycobacter roseus]|uniref:Uncharacterized protein n=1 Tax=Putridiphycobacter roseus TaxID=2219161 RepID=A0A2W1NAZ3_9FLAO|nr:hypothetical protein [Putridiphycobacter roseus]PZE16445.1 hypothetical protein DNU06_12925 [Putridiphycobacter roseus]
MKKQLFLFSGLLLFILSGCQTKRDALSGICEQQTISSFDQFLDISKNTPEVLLKDKLGKSTGGNYSADKKTFIYEFKQISRVPIVVNVNAASGEVKSILMEVLGLKDNFLIDVEAANANYLIDNCHLQLFGKQPKEILEIFGTPKMDNLQDAHEKTPVRTILYLSKDGGTKVRFNFYPSQDYKLSSVNVRWY